MKIAIALRTCDHTLNSWGARRFIEVDKQTLLLTCLNSLLKSITKTKHEVIFSIHDDNSSQQTLDHIDLLCKKYNVPYELHKTEKMGNFRSQYDWLTKQTANFFYCVEDDFLHEEYIFDEMIDMHNYLKIFVNQEGVDYAVYPWNSPQRYDFFGRMYPVMLFKNKDKYWRSDLQSTHTFFVTKQTFDLYEDIMKFQAYNWPDKKAWDDKTICQIWQEQITRLVVPLESLAYHMSDTDLPETTTLWKENLYEAR